ncbi:hypothetical protein F4823DRAFT_591394 [Ustulina deusta]|nr:hypothetical protein F4823DRAFT_591394 [Ustulina deusta]
MVTRGNGFKGALLYVVGLFWRVSLVMSVSFFFWISTAKYAYSKWDWGTTVVSNIVCLIYRGLPRR